MPYRIIPSFSDNFFHIYNRGNNKEQIFFEDRNYDFFLSRLLDSFETKISLVAYCLMPNHYHLIVYIKEALSLEKAMQRFSVSYTKAINKSYNRVGHLFQGRYQSKLIPNNEYLLHLSRYIHRNPLAANLVRNIEDWKYSSYLAYINKRSDNTVEKYFILDQFKSIESYKIFVTEYNVEETYYLKNLVFAE